MPDPIQTPQAPQVQQAGLSEDATCGLAYLLVPAIIFLATPPYNQNPKVRFHAWQSVCLAIACVVTGVVLGVIGAIPFVGLIDLLLGPVVGLGLTILWLIVMINAFMGKTIKIPIIAAFAEKQAGTTI